jgi:PTH2 family peptidyl-tRNA hydrolase
MSFQYKQAIIVRQDLKMSKGKTAAQVAHAAVSSYIAARRRRQEWAESWMNEGQKKVVLKAESMEEMLELKKMADIESLPNSLIADAVHRQGCRKTEATLKGCPNFELFPYLLNPRRVPWHALLRNSQAGDWRHPQASTR